jgi:hypothetical protein
LTWPVAVATGTDPKVFTPTYLVGSTAAWDKGIGAETRSIDPKVAAEPVHWEIKRENMLKKDNDKPCFRAPTLFRGILTPSLMGISWPGALGRREWDWRTGVDGAGDWERGEGAVDDWGRGPLAQADLAGSGVAFFGADAVEDLLILQRYKRLNEEKINEKEEVWIVAEITNF